MGVYLRFAWSEFIDKLSQSFRDPESPKIADRNSVISVGWNIRLVPPQPF
jgi:hypothetical protein